MILIASSSSSRRTNAFLRTRRGSTRNELDVAQTDLSARADRRDYNGECQADAEDVLA